MRVRHIYCHLKGCGEKEDVAYNELIINNNMDQAYYISDMNDFALSM